MLQSATLPPELPESFGSSDRWPKCFSVLRHQRNQGTCGSCWAEAATYVLETRLCIDTDGAFSGPSAWFSTLYAAACGKPGIARVFHGDGCQGGFASWVFELARSTGLPTGSAAREVGHTCLPYDLKGDSLQHFDAEQPHISCSALKSCSNPAYKKTLTEDLRILKFRYSTLESPITHRPKVQEAMQAIYESGPIVFAMVTYRDIFQYGGGIYRPSSSKDFLGYHSMGCVGFGLNTRKAPEGRYLECKNSWGASFGEMGSIRLDAEEVWGEFSYFQVVGQIS